MENKLSSRKWSTHPNFSHLNKIEPHSFEIDPYYSYDNRTVLYSSEQEMEEKILHEKKITITYPVREREREGDIKKVQLQI